MRDPYTNTAQDPLMEGAAANLGPHAIQNHRLCDSCRDCTFQLNGSPDWMKFTGIPSPVKVAMKSLPYISSQRARCQRPGLANRVNGESNDNGMFIPLDVAERSNLPSDRQVDKGTKKIKTTNDNRVTAAHARKPPPVEVKCVARTQIPTPHGPAFLHLYHNNRDSKEHLAIVIDPVQLNEPGQPSTDLPRPPHIRSQSLDAVWSDTETEMDRITRGAYTGRLSSTSQKASKPPPPSTGTPARAQIYPNPHEAIYPQGRIPHDTIAFSAIVLQVFQAPVHSNSGLVAKRISARLNPTMMQLLISPLTCIKQAATRWRSSPAFKIPIEGPGKFGGYNIITYTDFDADILLHAKYWSVKLSKSRIAPGEVVSIWWVSTYLSLRVGFSNEYYHIFHIL
ncbi:hypothetical protein L218DRAFT_1001877 [Marasmius fiardii PR-910]|nr:hypothetical protein L218DRAFT_1001877 [Marasmius fiardii PR-910]